MLNNVARRLFDEFKVKLALTPQVHEQLLSRCTSDLSNGGRGIGNQLESAFINPLSRAMFEHDLEGKTKLLIAGMTEQDKVITLTSSLHKNRLFMKIGINKAHFPVTVLGPANVSVSGCKVAASAARAACRKTPGSAIQGGT